MRKGFLTAGNWLVDMIKMIDEYPKPGHFSRILDQKSSCGGVFNTCIDLAIMDPTIPHYAAGIIGNDANGKQLLHCLNHAGVDTDSMSTTDAAPTSYTDVMTEQVSGNRTFFHSPGANALLTPEVITGSVNNARIFHLAYLLALESIDSFDKTYQVTAARLLHDMQMLGYKTSADAVSDSGDRFRSVVVPCLKYLDYFIINEIEAGEITGHVIRTEDDTIDRAALEESAHKLIELGVNDTVVIHMPEGAFAIDTRGKTAYAGSTTVAESEIVSSVGAGDAFCAGALYGLHEGWELKKILQIANASANFNLKSGTGTGGAVPLDTLIEHLNLR